MAKKEFDKLSDAEKIEALHKALDAAIVESSTKDELIKTQAGQIATLQQEVIEAQQIAEDAVNAANQLSTAQPNELTVKVGNKTYIINFGVDGLTKQELAEDQELLKRLVKIGSGAITLKED